jgi:hypothetical protein
MWFIFECRCLNTLDSCRSLARELFRVTAPGGHGYHQVDFRNHRYFEVCRSNTCCCRPRDFQRVLEATQFREARLPASSPRCVANVRSGRIRGAQRECLICNATSRIPAHFDLDFGRRRVHIYPGLGLLDDTAVSLGRADALSCSTSRT